MKKIFALVLAFIVMFALLCPALVYAEGAATPEPAPLIDLTGIVLSVVRLLFYALLAWLVKAVIPPVRRWLDAKTTAEQRSLMYQVVYELVNAAEQTIGSGRGSDKLAYVRQALREKGFDVDLDMIEAAVKQMNDEAEERMLTALGYIEIDGDPGTDETEPAATAGTEEE
ncbi:MAG: hypothetical protein IKO07_06000 [Clostridia bacterium]|nr:hypothetical protein [Clostridia bacterium]